MKEECLGSISSHERRQLLPPPPPPSDAAPGFLLAQNDKQHLSYTQPARESICVSGIPISSCPRCRDEGLSPTPWKPHRHIGEMKIRYICERNFQELDSNHHYDIPLCPLCSCVLYLYEFNALIGATNARKLHKYALKCTNKHVLPILDIFCQTRKGHGRCNANLKLQWCYGTMVARCESQKNRDHDLWWVRYKNEWKQRRTMIRYKKDFLSHLSDSQRGLLLSLGLEGDPPPNAKGTLGPSFETLLSMANNSPCENIGASSGEEVWRKRSFDHQGGSRLSTLNKKKRLKHFGKSLADIVVDTRWWTPDVIIQNHSFPGGNSENSFTDDSNIGLGSGMTISQNPPQSQLAPPSEQRIDPNDIVTGTPWEDYELVDAKKVIGQPLCYSVMVAPPPLVAHKSET